MLNPAVDLWAVVALVLLEIILGLDNFLFVSGKLVNMPPNCRGSMRLQLACLSLATRWCCLWALLWLIHCHIVFFDHDGVVVTLREVVLVVGGLFLFCKSICQPLSVQVLPGKRSTATSVFKPSVAFIATLTAFDSLCSVDSLIAAVALSERLWLILVALVAAEFVMVLFHNHIQTLMRKNGTLCIYANCFVAFLGCVLVFRGLGLAIPNEVLYLVMVVLICDQVFKIFWRAEYIHDRTKPREKTVN